MRNATEGECPLVPAEERPIETYLRRWAAAALHCSRRDQPVSIRGQAIRLIGKAILTCVATGHRFPLPAPESVSDKQQELSNLDAGETEARSDGR
jgi:hypothetical protein